MPEMALQGTVNENNQHFSWHNNGEKKKRRAEKMDISKRNAVRIVSFTAAVVGVLAVRNIQLMSSEKRALRSVNYTYSRAMGDLCDAVENVSDTLEKELYAGSGKMHQSLAVKLYREVLLHLMLHTQIYQSQ